MGFSGQLGTVNLADIFQTLQMNRQSGTLIVAGPADTVQLTLARSGRQLAIAAGTPLLAALEAAGLNPEHGCRQGLCGRCTCAKPEGVHVDLRDGAVHPEASRALKLCISAARSDLTLDL